LTIISAENRINSGDGKMTEVREKKKDQQTRMPKQLRSINKKEKILEAAMELYYEKGYYKTTTNEIAQRAGVSIGTLYSYFKDKDTVFFEVLDKYHKTFTEAKDEIINDPDLLRTDIKLWLRYLFKSLIKVHEESKLFNREINVISYYNPEVAAIVAKNRQSTMKETVGYFLELKEEFEADDVEAVAAVIFDLISATVDRIVFGQNEISRERLIDSTIDIVYSYLKYNQSD
jgi:AcrR family transcriptional regulator